MKYLFLLSYDATRECPDSAEYQQMETAYRAAIAAMAQAGVLVDCAPLQPAAMSTTVRVRNGQVLLTDGPAAEIKEQVGGYTLVECADLDEALRWAAKVPAAATGWVEVRPVVDLVPPA